MWAQSRRPMEVMMWGCDMSLRQAPHAVSMIAGVPTITLEGDERLAANAVEGLHHPGATEHSGFAAKRYGVQLVPYPSAEPSTKVRARLLPGPGPSSLAAWREL